MSKLITLARSGLVAAAIIALVPHNGTAQRIAAGDNAPSHSDVIRLPASLSRGPATPVQPAFETQAEERASFGNALVGASLGMVVGIVGGAAVGGSRADCDYPYSETDFCGYGEALLGAAAGGALGSAAGAWIGAHEGGGTPSIVWTGLAGLGGIGTGFLAGMIAERAGLGSTLSVLAYLAGQALLPALVAAGT